MNDLVRETALGYVLRAATRGRLYGYPEDKPGFKLPETYLAVAEERRKGAHEKAEPMPKSDAGKSAEKIPQKDEGGDAEKLETIDLAPAAEEPTQTISRMTTSTSATTTTTTDSRASHADGKPIEKVHTIDQNPNLHRVQTTSDLERAVTAATMKKTATRPIIPTKTADGVVLVDWWNTDDADNPQNWSPRKKALVMVQICLYTLAVYMGSSIYTASEPAIIEIFGTTQTVASLGLALYVLGYGTGPLLFSPLSEIPVVGRNLPYISTFAVFVLLWIPAGLVNNVPGLLVLRFLQGFFGSPCLATAGATIQDMYNILQLPFLMTIWVSAATLGPSLGPLISGFSIPALDWHWSMWEILIVSGPIFLMMFALLPETSASNILLRRARRLRWSTGNPSFKSQSELDQAQMTASAIVVESLLRPFEITIKDPSVLFATLYTAFCYAIYYVRLSLL